jgi:beta-glucosidase
MPQPPLETFEQVGFAFNKGMLDLLRAMGHQGYVNSDSGILSKMAWGVAELSVPERVGKAVMAGTDIVADTNDVGSIREAFLRGLFTTERLDEAARRLTEEMFALGLFDNPYVDPQRADEVVANEAFAVAARAAHHKSVVLMKNSDRTLPLGPDRLAGKRVYVELFEQALTVAKLDGLRENLAAEHPGIRFTTDFSRRRAGAVPQPVHRRLLPLYWAAGPGGP